MLKISIILIFSVLSSLSVHAFATTELSSDNCGSSLVATPFQRIINFPTIEGKDLHSHEAIEERGRTIKDFAGRLSRENTEAFMNLSDTNSSNGIGNMYGTGISGQKSLLELNEEFNSLVPRLQPPANFAQPTTSRFQLAYRSTAKRLGANVAPTVQEYLTTYSAEKPKFEAVLTAFQSEIDAVQKNKDRAIEELDVMQNLIRSKRAEREQLVQERTRIEAEIEAQNLSFDLSEKARFSLITPLDQLIDSLDEHIKSHGVIAAQKESVIEQTDVVVDTVARVVSITVPAIRNSAIVISDALQNQRLVQAADATRAIAMSSIQAASHILAQSIEDTDRLRVKPVLDNNPLEASLTTLRDAMARSQHTSENLPALIAEGRERTTQLQKQIDAMNDGKLLRVENRRGMLLEE